MTETKALSKEQIGILHHSLGMTKQNRRRPIEWWLDNDKHRNYYYASCRNPEIMARVRDLVRLGFMEAGEFADDGMNRFFYVTQAGIIEAKKHRPEW